MNPFVNMINYNTTSRRGGSKNTRSSGGTYRGASNGKHEGGATRRLSDIVGSSTDGSSDGDTLAALLSGEGSYMDAASKKLLLKAYTKNKKTEGSASGSKIKLEVSEKELTLVKKALRESKKEKKARKEAAGRLSPHPV